MSCQGWGRFRFGSRILYLSCTAEEVARTCRGDVFLSYSVFVLDVVGCSLRVKRCLLLPSARERSQHDRTKALSLFDSRKVLVPACLSIGRVAFRAGRTDLARLKKCGRRSTGCSRARHARRGNRQEIDRCYRESAPWLISASRGWRETAKQQQCSLRNRFSQLKRAALPRRRAPSNKRKGQTSIGDNHLEKKRKVEITPIGGSRHVSSPFVAYRGFP